MKQVISVRPLPYEPGKAKSWSTLASTWRPQPLSVQENVHSSRAQVPRMVLFIPLPRMRCIALCRGNPAPGTPSLGPGFKGPISPCR